MKDNSDTLSADSCRFTSKHKTIKCNYKTNPPEWYCTKCLRRFKVEEIKHDLVLS